MENSRSVYSTASMPPPSIEIDTLPLLWWYVTVYPMVYITSYSRLESSCPWPSTTGPGTAFHSFIEIYICHQNRLVRLTIYESSSRSLGVVLGLSIEPFISSANHQWQSDIGAGQQCWQHCIESSFLCLRIPSHVNERQRYLSQYKLLY